MLERPIGTALKIKKFWNSESALLRSAYEPRMYCGIDPGAEGSFASLDQEGNVIETFGFKDMTEQELFNRLTDALKGVYGGQKPMFCMLEKVHAVPGWGIASSFKFGQHFGFVRAAIVASGIPFDTVTPKKWQGKMRCRSGGDKNVPLMKAQQLFPDIKMCKTGKSAVYDSLLLADYGRRVTLGLEFN